MKNDVFKDMARAIASLQTINAADLAAQLLNEAFNGSPDGSYPPTDVVAHGDNDWEVRLAVAGFAQDELDVTVERDNGVHQLVVTGQKKSSDQEPPIYIRHGISQRMFKSRFNLPRDSEVASASYELGILSVKIHREVKPQGEDANRVQIEWK